MRVVGLTGGIGAGKSTVARLLARRGAVVLDADQLAREVVAPESPGLAAVVAAFGADILRPDGTLDRAALGQRVFSDPEARARLEAITHPRIFEAFREQAEAARRAGAALVVLEAALLVDSEGRITRPALDGLIWVTADRAERIRRVVRRDGLPPEAVAARMAAQIPDSLGRAAADWVVVNNGDAAALQAQVERLWAALVGAPEAAPQGSTGRAPKEREDAGRG